jgi:hypothetical protein
MTTRTSTRALKGGRKMEKLTITSVLFIRTGFLFFFTGTLLGLLCRLLLGTSRSGANPLHHYCRFRPWDLTLGTTDGPRGSWHRRSGRSRSSANYRWNLHGHPSRVHANHTRGTNPRGGIRSGHAPRSTVKRSSARGKIEKFLKNRTYPC